MGLKITTIHHIALICSDYEKSKVFYTNLLGFTILNETYREERESYKLDLLGENGIQLELFSFPHPPERPSRPEARGLRHLAFHTSEFDEAINYLEKNKVEVEPVRIDPITGKRFTFFRDPDNLPLELYE
jgi:glyoxylase I family protein